MEERRRARLLAATFIKENGEDLNCEKGGRVNGIPSLSTV